MTERELAKQIGVSQPFISFVLRGKRYTTIEKALAIELATGGKYKVEDLVRPEVAEALRKFLALRCPMLQKLASSSGLQSVEEEEKTTVGAQK